MKTSTASAPGKAILAGEHAVVYGFPAIAVPIRDISATAEVFPGPEGSGFTIESPALGATLSLAAKESSGLAYAACIALGALRVVWEPDASLVIRSSIPVASGLGSGAAVSAAAIKAVLGSFAITIPPPTLSALVFEVEKLYHGTPSGIDNAVICLDQCVLFSKQKPVEAIAIRTPFDLVVADTGIRSLTRDAVAKVREGLLAARARYDHLFIEIGSVAMAAKDTLLSGDLPLLGNLLTRNQILLQELGVSSTEIEALVKAAMEAGALGAKLSGAGLGGNVIALPKPGTTESVAQALLRAGAANVIKAHIS